VPLRSFDRSIFTDKDPPMQEVCNFVLALALFYNDFKDIIYAFILHQDQREKVVQGINPDWGQWSGIREHQVRILLGTLWEFLELVRVNRPAWKHPYFSDFIPRLPDEAFRAWSEIQDVVDNGSTKHAIWRKVMLFRQNVAFHYATKCIAQGYDHHFYKSGKDNSVPYWSEGSSMEENRFYFADAAAQSFVEKELGSKTKEFWIEVDRFYKQLNSAVGNIVRQFIRKRGG
jgi:hypothetical protein